jgi:hydroxymethylbilane synthase
MPPLRIGTRGSALALWQANHVKARLEDQGEAVELRAIATSGDRMLDRRLESIGGKGAFLKEIEEALLAGEIDLAVHSLKDVPTQLPDGLTLCAFLERADPRDALVSRSGAGLDALPRGARLGTTSLRRQSQLRARRPDLVVADLRGNVDTRLRRLREGAFDAILLAVAGIARLGRAAEISERLDPDVLLPAPGQGVVALECRAGDERMARLAAALHHPPTARAVTAERAFLSALGGGCNVPLGALAELGGGAGLRLRAYVGREDGGAWLRAEDRGVDPEALARGVAEELLQRGARAFLGR